MQRSAMILFGHGARDPEWAIPMRDVQRRLQAAGMRAEMAFLEFMQPTLPECVLQLYSQGYRCLTIMPVFIAQGGHLKKEFPAMLENLRQLYPGLDLRITPAVGSLPSVLQAIADAGLEAIRSAPELGDPQ